MTVTRFPTLALSTLCLLAAPLFATPALAQEQVVIGHGSGQVELTHPGLFLPQALGWDEEEGLDITIELTQGSQQAMQLLAAGQVDILSISSSTVFDAREQGIEARIFYSEVNHNNNFVAVLADGPYDAVGDLAGTDVGVFSMTSGGVPFLKAVLAEAGLGETDVTMVPIGAGPAALEGLRNGTVSALSLWAGALANFENEGVALTLFGSERLDSAPGFVLATSDAYLEANPSVIEKMGRLYAKAHVFAEANPEATVRLYWEAFPEARPAEVTDAAIAAQVHILGVGLRDMRVEGRPDTRYGWNDAAGIEVFQDYLIENGARTVEVPVDDTYTNDFVDAFNDFDADAVRALAAAR